MGIGLFTDAYFLSIPLKGRFQALPFHIPQSVFRESGISLRTTVPTGTHHRDNGKQAAISRQVKRKSFILEIVSIRQISIFLYTLQQGFQRLLRLIQADGSHSYQREIPSPSISPVPIVQNMAQRFTHNFLIQVSRCRKETVSGQLSRMPSVFL